jgi:tRNA 2-thiocytidine biosynthesis protein TtcA
MSKIVQLEQELARELGRCVADFGLIQAGDRIMVCMSGGKDSYTMLHLLERARRKAPVAFSLLAVHLDQGHPGYDGRPLSDWLSTHGFDYRVLREDTYSVVKAHVPAGKTYCSLCSRLRRGVLYNAAVELGCNKIALGHHRDDAIETLLLNLMFSGSLKSMPPKLVSDDGKHIVIRPLAYVAEKDLVRWAQHREFPIIPCTLCGSQENLQRKQVGEMLREWDKKHPGRVENMFTALQNVVPSHLLDGTRHDFKCLKAQPARGDAWQPDEGDAPAPRTLRVLNG